MIKAVIFDFDGTIADTLRPIFDFAVELADDYGYDIEEHYDTYREMDPKIIEDKIPKPKIPKYVAHMRRKLAKIRDELTIFEEMKPILEECSKQYKLGLVSSSSRKVIKHVFKKYGLDQYFSEKIVGVPVFGKSKRLQKIVKKLGVTIDEAVYVDDSHTGIEACRKIGMKIISVTWGFQAKKLLEQYGPDYFADKPEDILRILDEIKGIASGAKEE